MKVWCTGRPRAVDVLAMPHPGFPTDLQQPIVAVLSVGAGTSVITDHVFENRFKYIAELQRMGADIRVESRSAIVKGVDRLSGAAQVIASAARAPYVALTTIDDVYPDRPDRGSRAGET